MRRAWLSLTFCVVTLLMVATPALAKEPVREPFVLPDVIEDTSCGFLVVVTFPVQQEFITTFFDSAGEPVKQIITGRLVATMTNPSNGVTVTIKISGPFHTFLATGVSYASGRVGGPVGFEPGLNDFSGRVNLVTGELRGHLEPLCPVLAGA
jgi:hypothetical protein